MARLYNPVCKMSRQHEQFCEWNVSVTCVHEHHKQLEPTFDRTGHEEYLSSPDKWMCRLQTSLCVFVPVFGVTESTVTDAETLKMGHR